ncbi:MAG: VPLPA-CTERM sorting domain-containing protein [Pseudomonadota bacterium]
MTWKIGLAAMALACTAGVADAATVAYTEGARPRVEGTTKLSDVAGSASGAYDVFTNDGGALGGSFDIGDVVRVYGRVVGGVDTYTFDTSTDFTIRFIFGGYDLANGGSVNESGFVSETVAEKTATFRLTNTDTNDIQTVTYTTDITGGNSFIFAGGPGTYLFSIDGRGDQGRPVGLYDLRITAVPLPASALLMLTALGGVAVASRRTRKA